MTDIVERLRVYVKMMDECGKRGPYEELTEAADEIERLRNTLDGHMKATEAVEQECAELVGENQRLRDRLEAMQKS